MAWEIKYYTEFTDILNVDWKVDIEESGFAGTATALQSTGSPLNIEYLSTSEDFIGGPICGSVASISVYSDADFSFMEFYSYGRLTYRVSIYYNTTLFWQGYINSEGYQEPYDGISYPVVISASDMLGQLKDKPYKYTTTTTDDTYYNGLMAESQIVLDILGKINITQFTEYINIYEDSMLATATDSPFNQIYIDVDVFKDMDCYQVLSELLNKYNAVIRQVAGKMIIYRPVDLKLLPIKGRVFTAVNTSSAASDLNSETLFDRDASTSDFHDTEGGSLSIIAPAKKISLNQDYGYKESWIENYDFKLETYTSPNVWEGWADGAFGYAFSLNEEVPEEKDGMAITAVSTQYDYSVTQTFGTYLKATSDMCVISFDYYLYSYSGGDLSDITISMKIKADNADKWLGVDDEETASWHDTAVYVDITDAIISNGRSGWVSVTRSIPDGLPVDGPYTIEVYNPYCSSSFAFYCGFKNIKFRSTSSMTFTKLVAKSFWQRFEGQIGWGEFQYTGKYKRVRVYQPADDKNVVLYTHVKTNALEGRELEYNYILGDVPSTSTPASEADTDLDNTIEQFSGALAAYTTTNQYRVDTVTLTGGGALDEAEITCDGVAKAVEYDTNLPTTAANFVTDWAADYVAGGVVVTSSGVDIIFTSNVLGAEFTGTTSITPVIGTLDGTVVLTTASHIHTTAPSSTWASRGNSEDSFLLDIIGDEIKDQYARPKISLSVPIIEKDTTSKLPHVDLLGCFKDNLNVNQLLTPVRTPASWTLSNCTLVANWPYMRFTSTTNDPQMITGTLALNGAKSRHINIRYKVVSGIGNGVIYYSTSGHGFSDSYYKDITLTADGAWHVHIADMGDLTAGGTDYITNIITALRIDLTGADAVVIDIDWIGFPRKFVFNGGIFNAKDREYDLTLSELIY